MKILVPVDGSPFTKRMLAYLAAHDEWLGDAHQYTLLHVAAADLAQLDAALESVVAELLQGGPGAQGEVKALLRDIAGAPLDAALRRRTNHRLARLRLSQEAQARIAAFLARRKRL